MGDFIALSRVYNQINKDLRDHGHNSADSIKVHIRTMINCLNRVHEVNTDEEFNNHINRVLKTLTADEITPSLIEEIWESQHVPKLIKQGSMIFTPFLEVELITKRLQLPLTNTQEQHEWELLYKCLDYNSKMITKQTERLNPEIDPRAEYLLRHSEEIIQFESSIKLNEIMSYPVSYVATPIMLPPPSKFTNGIQTDKLEIYNDLCELHAIALLAFRWIQEEEEEHKKINAVQWLLVVSNVKTLLPMRCRYASTPIVSLHLNHVAQFIDVFIANPDDVSALTSADQHLRLLANDLDKSGALWKDVEARYAQTNINYRQQQQQEEEEEEEQNMNNNNNNRMAMIEVNGKKKQKQKKKKKKNVEFKVDTHRS